MDGSEEPTSSLVDAMTLQTNPQLELALEYVRNTNNHLFLTGKAGTGKTTFLHQIKTEGLKRMAVVAPTGVAAINAGGMTIHSLFQIPIGLHLPGVERKDSGQRPHLRGEKIRLIQSLDLLVIDEISMVRADVLDAVDQVLRRFRGPRQPFGGVQLLMIGDLHQLPPVVKPDEWDLLRKYYDTPYFFGSHALRQTTYISIELKHIYRQADPEFIGLLNRVRHSQLDEVALQQLNRRYIPNFQPTATEPYITLTATNAAAHEINRRNLQRLPGDLQSFSAEVIGDFPPSSFPTEQVLELKVGAQVMFIKNDLTSAKSYFNGKLGRVTAVDEEGVCVVCYDSSLICVAQAEWKNVKYVLNEETKEVEEQVLGVFLQFPLRLAWAITIHKSQGLTFERCIIDAQAAFATGQVYVALSRCKSLDGIVLRSPISLGSVKTDPVVQRFSEQSEQNFPTESQLLSAKRDYQAATVRELFRFDATLDAIRRLQALCVDHANTVLPETRDQIGALASRVFAELVQVSEKFAPQLDQYLADDTLPEMNDALQTRVQKGAQYFMARLDELSKEAVQGSAVMDNQDVAKQFGNAMRSLLLAMAVKHACFVACQTGFSTERVNRARINAELDFCKNKRQPDPRTMVVPKGIPHPELYRQLLSWREEAGDRNRVTSYGVIPNATLREIVVRLPTDKKMLLELPGIGKGRLRRYGEELLAIIQRYRQDHNITRLSDGSTSAGRASHTPETKSAPTETKRISFSMYRAGKSVEQIAAERKLVSSTIVGHLAYFVGIGQLSVFELLEPHKVEEIQRFLVTHPSTTTAETKAHFGDKYDYGELKLVASHLDSQQEHRE